MKKMSLSGLGLENEAQGGPLGSWVGFGHKKPSSDSSSSASTFGLVSGSPVFMGIRTDTQNYRNTDRITNRQAYKVGDYCFNVGKEWCIKASWWEHQLHSIFFWNMKNRVPHGPWRSWGSLDYIWSPIFRGGQHFLFYGSTLYLTPFRRYWLKTWKKGFFRNGSRKWGPRRSPGVRGWVWPFENLRLIHPVPLVPLVWFPDLPSWCA